MIVFDVGIGDIVDVGELADFVVGIFGGDAFGIGAQFKPTLR